MSAENLVDGTRTEASASADNDSVKSLAEELESLDIIEADELQEGVAFHAFQFAT